ncbi:MULTISPECIES: hypothetical protein [unclassified Streptomyces]|uniref:hypothetical protein n=1 Tax=unclassified Streptomyces TaxID=2593676 RepID=UPI0011B028ED|nr:hypothetical protein [Streptomyces sp. SM10]
MTAFGEMLAEHTFVPGDPGTPPAALDDWARALDAYDAASRALHRRRQKKAVPHLLQEGLTALADLEARVAGSPVPRRFPPCFFDPRHGQSTTEASWAPHGGTKRLVAVCAADAIRLREGSSLPLSPYATSGELDDPFRHPQDDLSNPWLIGLFVLLLGYAIALTALGDMTGAILSVTAGGTVGGIALLSALLVWSASVDLWSLMRRGHRTQATFARSAYGRHGAHEHVFVVTDASGRRCEYTQRAHSGAANPAPSRTVWYLPKADSRGKALSAWSPVWLPLRVLVGLPFLLGSTAITLYLIPGRLITILLS